MKETISTLLALPDIRVIDFKILGQELHITVESTLKGTRCQRCGRRITQYHGKNRERVLRHLPCFGMRTFIHIKQIRYECEQCHGNPTTTQSLSWCGPRTPHTKAYEDHILLQLVNSTVSDVEIKENIGYESMMGILDRRIAVEVDWDRIKHLQVIGVDEISLKKGHKDFVAIITGRIGDRIEILAVLEDREKDTVKKFFLDIPKRLRKGVRAVCTDIYKGFINAAKEVFSKKVKVVIDRFHVAKLYRGAVDELRKQELRRLKKELPEGEFRKLKGAMWALRKKPTNWTPEDVNVLRKLFQYSPVLEIAYDLAGILTNIFDTTHTRRGARRKIKNWIELVKNSGLVCFNKFLGTITNWMEEILNYFDDRDTSGFVEGLNNKIKVTKRRCYGIVNVKHLFQRIFLDLGGPYDLGEPALIS